MNHMLGNIRGQILLSNPPNQQNFFTYASRGMTMLDQSIYFQYFFPQPIDMVSQSQPAKFLNKINGKKSSFCMKSYCNHCEIQGHTTKKCNQIQDFPFSWFQIH